MLLCMLGACSAANDDPASSKPSSRNARVDQPGAGTDSGTTRQGQGSGNDLGQMQDGAESAAEQVASGDGLRVKNTTEEPIALVFPDGAVGWVKPGKSVVILRPCHETVPLRVEARTGDLIAERNGPCRRRATWVIGN